MALSEPSESFEGSKIEMSDYKTTLEVKKPMNVFPGDQESEIKPMTANNRERSYNYSDVLLVYNGNSALSIKIAKYFQNARNIPEINMVNLTNISAVETVSRTVFEEIRGQIESHLDNNNLTDKINYIVTTKGVPLRVSGGGETNACLDNELTLIKGNYQGYIGNTRWLINPYFEDNDPFSKEKYDLYLVTRLTGFTWPEIKRLIDNATTSPGIRGTFVLDEDATKGYSGGYGIGNVWLRDAKIILTEKGEQTYYDDTDTFVTGQTKVMGYASWGSNDAHDTTNFVANYGFESASGNIPNNWFIIHDPGITDNISINTTDFYSGSKSIMINRSAISANYTAIAQNISITPEIRYYLHGRFNITGLSGPGGAHLQIQTLDNQNKILKVQNTNFRSSTTSSWISFSQVIYEPNPNAVMVRILAVVNQSSGIALFDHITFNDILPHNNWLPGAIAETFVSTGGRSFNYGTSYGQSLVADLIRDGVTGVKGYVYEPYLSAIAHPDILFNRFTDGYNLAESYYMASNFLGWMDVVVGDPKMAPYADVLPDLNISVHGIRCSPEIPDENQEIIVNYTVTNLGNRTDKEFIIKVYRISGGYETYITEHKIEGIEGYGTTRQFEFEFIAENAGEIDLKIDIDPENIYKEFRKDNNLVVKKIYVNHLPNAQELIVNPERIYRTEEFQVQVLGSDVETSLADLSPVLEAKLEPSGEWFEFNADQRETEYNSSADSWDTQISSNKTMVLGKYSFRISFIDENNAIGNYYFLHLALEVMDNVPNVNEITFDRLEINRTEQIWANINVSDIEDEFFELEVEAQFRLKPEDLQSPSGWKEVDYLQSSAKINWTSPFMEDFWVAMIEFKTDSKIGYYQFRTRVIDTDFNASDWVYPENYLMVNNNPPQVLNITFEDLSVYRTNSIQIELKGTDAEDQVRLSSLGCEIEYKTTEGPGVGDEGWEKVYLTDIEFNIFTDSWKTIFRPPKTAQIGNYSFRGRVIDTDGNMSKWLYINDSVFVMNNPPVAELSDSKLIIHEDDEITLKAKESDDSEDAKADLEFYWELGNDEGPFIVTFNETFTFILQHKGEYYLRFRVKDTDNATSWDERDITVENVKPTAKIGISNRNPKINEMITFNAAGSSDTTSDIESLKYTWDFGDSNNNPGEGKIINYSYPEAKRYTVTLTVTDDDGSAEQVTVIVIVAPEERGDETDDDEDSQMAFLIAGGAIIVIIFLVLFFLLILKKKRKIKEAEEPIGPTTEMIPSLPTQIGIKELEGQLEPYPELDGPPAQEKIEQEFTEEGLPAGREPEQMLEPTEMSTLPAKETPQLPPTGEDLPEPESIERAESTTEEVKTEKEASLESNNMEEIDDKNNNEVIDEDVKDVNDANDAIDAIDANEINENN